jgi:glycogen debranching enzyme
MSNDMQKHFAIASKSRPEIRVGPPRLTIYSGSLVLVTDNAGEIEPNTETGLFFRDTRFVSHLNVAINGHKWSPIQSTPLRSNAHRLYFTNPELQPLDESPIPPQALSFELEREAGDCLYEQLRVCNYSNRSLNLRLTIVIDSDFADLFDVRNRRFFSRGMRDSYWNGEERELRILYRSEDFKRALLYRLGTSAPEPHFSNGQILFELALKPGACWETRNAFVPLLSHDLTSANTRLKPQESRQAFVQACEEKQADWRSSTTKLAGDGYALRTIFGQAVEDIWSLRMVEELDADGELWLPTAGVPWFATLFGRDSLIVSLQCMLISPPFALGALIKLAELQAREHDPYRDAEPGKIMHEIRYGELAERRLIPHTPYYGTADATILYLIVLSELFRWTGDRGILERLRETALACLRWIDYYGDRDGDGFQEYQTRSPKGYYNQGWKDASDASVNPDGSQVKLPIATCELQGYVYDAKLRMAQMFEALGDTKLPDRLRRDAERLRQRFDQAFWLEQEGYIAYCLDGDKRPVASVTSNPGQCLWSGIVESRRARAIVERLFKDDMWSGWGIRTLSANHPAYNPLEYQRGSVWPHDNGIIAAGLAAYGYREAAERVASAIFDAASMFAHFRLPELFAGFPRDSESCPVQYLQANTPQAWASGCVFHLIRTMLGIHPDTPHGKLYIDPMMPEGVDQLSLINLHVGHSRLSLKFSRAAGKPKFDVIDGSPGDLTIEPGPPPWFAYDAADQADKK